MRTTMKKSNEKPLISGRRSSCKLLLLSCFLHLAISFSPQDSGDAYVILYKDDTTRTSQLKLFLGEQFLVDIPLRNSDHSEDYDVINLVNVTQSYIIISRLST
uniref:Uncharacterized protein n=1 Tax=Cacopsylla melanoneura TaxID=428564 RepID=A0A8D8UI60_9HEMI